MRSSFPITLRVALAYAFDMQRRNFFLVFVFLFLSLHIDRTPDTARSVRTFIRCLSLFQYCIRLAMTALRSLWWLFLLYLAVSALFERAIMQESPFSCTGYSGIERS